MILTIEAETAEELKAKVLEVAKSFYDQISPGPINIEVLNPNGVDPAPPKVKGKPGRKPGWKPVQKEETPVVEASVPEVKPTPEIKIPVNGKGQPYTKADTINALQKVNSSKGIMVAKQVLSKFNCQRISELPETAYGEFVAECNAQS